MGTIATGAKVFAGACVVYVVMAACTSSGSSPSASGPGVDGTTQPDGAPGANPGGNGPSVIDPVAEAKASSGSRLKARWRVGADGSKEFVGWQDSARNDACAFQRASDGKTRCLPTDTVTTQYFADAGCSQPLGLAYCTAVVPKYALRVGTLVGTCLGGADIFPVIGVHSGAAFTGTPGACSSFAPPAGSFTLLDLGAAAAPSEFVEGTDQVDP